MWKLHKTVQENWLQWEKYCNPLITVESRTEDGIWQIDRTPSCCLSVVDRIGSEYCILLCMDEKQITQRWTKTNITLKRKRNKLKHTDNSWVEGKDIEYIFDGWPLAKTSSWSCFFPSPWGLKTEPPTNIHTTMLTKHREGHICSCGIERVSKRLTGGREKGKDWSEGVKACVQTRTS